MSETSHMESQGWSKEDAEKYMEQLRKGKTPSEANKYVKEPQFERIKFKQPREEIIEEEEIEEVQRAPRADFISMKEKAATEEDEYIEELESKERSKDIISGIFGFGSRTPVKEAIVSGVVSGATKLVKALKGKPKTEKEIAREEKIKDAQTERRVKEITSPSSGRRHSLSEEMGFGGSSRRHGGSIISDYEEREPSFRDIGKGSMGAERYGESKPDFFGGEFGTSSNPLGEPTRTRRSKAPETKIPHGGSRAPETRIPFGGSRAPSTIIPFGGSRAPSTSFPSAKGRVVSTKIPSSGKVVSTRIPLIRGKAPETKYQGAKRVSTRIPKGQRKAPVVLAKKGKPISTRIGRPSKIKTRVPQIQEDALDVLGLKGFF